jgi:YidC/Oxa1 family membrane protein insertase
MSWYDSLLRPIMVVVSWIMVGVHDLLAAIGLDPASGATWALSIVALTVVVRAALIPLFVKQIRAARAMQMLSPELQALQKKYKGRSDPASREAMTRETMELYQKHGTNPMSSCLPILAQSPIFFALFRLLNSLDDIARGDYPTIGSMTQEVAAQAETSEIFGAPISAYFFQPDATTQVKIVTVALIVAMSLTTFTTQKQLTQKNMPATAMQGPMAQQQKLLLYMMPLLFAVSGVNFPIGVLIYWTTTNIWSMGQQFYVIRRNPTPGSEAERRLKERQARKAAKKGIVLEPESTEPEKPRGQRQQPVRKDRARPSAATRPAGTAAGKQGARPAGQKPGQKPAGAKPTGDKPTGDKPAGDKAAGDKAAERAAGGKPATGKAPKAGGAKAGGPKQGQKPAGSEGGKPPAKRPTSASGGTKPRRPRPAPEASDQGGDAPEAPKDEK